MPNLTSDQIKKAKGLAVEIINEILFSANATNIQDKYAVILGKIGASYLNEPQTQSLLNEHEEFFEEFAGLLKSLGEDEAFNLVDQLGKLAYQAQWQPKQIQKPDTSDDNAENLVKLYKAKNGELCLRFQNKQKADEFLKSVGQSVIPPNFRTGIQFNDNPQGLTPFQYADNSNNKLFCPSYKAKNGEFATNLGSLDVVDRFIVALHFKFELALKYRMTGDGKFDCAGLFSCYRFLDKVGHAQEGTLYFNQQNPIFTVPGAYIEVNTKTGELKQGVVQNYNSTITPRQVELLSLTQQVNANVNSNFNFNKIDSDNNITYNKVQSNNINTLFYQAPKAMYEDIPGIGLKIQSMIGYKYGCLDYYGQFSLTEDEMIIGFTNPAIAKDFYETFLKNEYSSAQLDFGRVILTNTQAIKNFVEFVETFIASKNTNVMGM